MCSQMLDEVYLAKVLRGNTFCSRCILRFFGKQRDFHLKSITEVNEYEVAAKKIKYASSDDIACRACCGILQDRFLRVFVLHNSKVLAALEYDCDSFLTHISIPLAILLRQHSVAYELKEKYAFTDEKIAQIVPINKAWSLSIKNILEALLDKPYHKNSPFSIEFEINYRANELEIKNLQAWEKEMEAAKKPVVKLSKSHIDEFIEMITPEVFRQKFKYPAPGRPIENLSVSTITCVHEPTYVAGRYCKYSRSMGQTPWVLDDVKVVKDSVQDIIFNILEPVFKADKLIFSASGREDFDVRTLGRGRPFYIRIVNPKQTRISFEKFREMEREVGKSGVVEVKDLQFVEKSSLSVFKEGEEHKKKAYKALCVVDTQEDVKACVQKINFTCMTGPLTIRQVTPVRVSHRRSSDTRPRKIYVMKASHVKGTEDLFKLEMVTQAGTYVKEFVHGDFNRTVPSLAQIVGRKVDILALDVLDIDLDFPPVVSSIQPANELFKWVAVDSEEILGENSDVDMAGPENPIIEVPSTPSTPELERKSQSVTTEVINQVSSTASQSENEGLNTDLIRAICQETCKFFVEYIKKGNREEPN